MSEAPDTTFALVITAKDEKAALPQNVKYHRFVGAERIFVYDDGSTDGTAEALRDLPGVSFQPSVPFEKYAHLPHFREGIRYPRTDYQFRMMLNAYDALLQCREQGIDWLIMLDADELACPHTAYVYPGQLNDLLAAVPYDAHEVRFPTLEVLQRQFQYDDVFQGETLFKRSSWPTELEPADTRTRRVIHRLFRYGRKARGLLPMSKDARHQLVQNPTPIRRQLLHPVRKRQVPSNGFYGHLYGKAAVRTHLDIWPVNTHFFQAANGERLPAVSRGHLLHYQFHSFSEFVSKPAKHPLPELLASVRELNPVKRMFFEIMHDGSLSERELEAYYRRWVMFSDSEVAQLRAPKRWGIIPKDDALVEVDTVRRVLSGEAKNEVDLGARISVVIPAYNAARHLRDAIDSIVAQTYRDWELIVVNDGSTDDTAAIVQRYADEDARITLINQENLGEIAARRRGFEESSGAYVYFLDADDRSWPDALQRFHNTLSGFPEAVAAFGCHRTIGKGGWIRSTGKAFIPPERPTHILPKLLILNFIQPGAICIRRKHMAAADFSSTISFGGDWVMWCRLAAKGPFVHVGDRPLCDYRMHDQNISGITRSPLEKREKPVEIIFSDPEIMASISPHQKRVLRERSLYTTYFYAGIRSLEAMHLRTALTCVQRGALCVLRAPSTTSSAVEELIRVRRRIVKGLIPPITGQIDRALSKFPPVHAAASKVGRGLRRGKRLPTLLRHGDIDPANFLVFQDRKVAYLVSSKVACTSIRLTMGKAYGLHVPRPMLIHDDSLWNIQRGRLKGGARDFHSFAFVRDPFERLVSCYCDRVLYDGPKEFAMRPFFADYIYSIPPNIPFEEFARIVARIPDRLADRHFKSQTHDLYSRGRLRVDFLGRFENLEVDWKVVADRFGFDPALPVANRSSATSGDDDYRAYYTPELVELVYQRYRDDVELLGYGDAYRSLRKVVQDDAGGAA